MSSSIVNQQIVCTNLPYSFISIEKSSDSLIEINVNQLAVATVMNYF